MYAKNGNQLVDTMSLISLEICILVLNTWYLPVLGAKKAESILSFRCQNPFNMSGVGMNGMTERFGRRKKN